MEIRLIRRPHTNPIVRACGIDPTDPYLEWCWLPVVGPSTVALVRRVAELTSTRGEARIPLADLGRLLGLGAVDVPACNNKLVRTLARAEQFALRSPASESRASTSHSASTTKWRWSRPGCWSGCPRSPGFATLRLWRQPTRPWRPLAFLRLGRRCRPTGGPLSALAPSPRPPRPDSRPQRHSGPGAPCPRSPVSTQAWWPRRRRPSPRCDLDAPPTLRATNPRRARNEPAHRYSPAHATRVPGHVPGIPNEGPGRPPITRHTHAGSPPVNLRAPGSGRPGGPARSGVTFTVTALGSASDKPSRSS